MSDVKTIEGDFTSGKGEYAIVVGRWNSFVVEHLLEGAIDTLRRHGVSDKQISVVRAPGAFEIPLVCKQVAGKAVSMRLLPWAPSFEAVRRTLSTLPANASRAFRRSASTTACRLPSAC